MKSSWARISSGIALLACAMLFACDMPRPLPRGQEGFAQFIRPVTHPAYFESALIEDEARIFGTYHKFANEAPTGGGDIRGYGVQARFELNDDTAFVINKLSFYDFNPNDSSDEVGFSDLGLGLKYALLRRPRENLIVTLGVGYEFAQGSRDVLQGGGKGLWNPYLATAKAFGQFNFMATVGYLMPLSTSRQSTELHYHLHVDAAMWGDLRPFVEFNGYRVTNDGSKVDIDFEGADLINFAARRSDESDFLSAGAGFRYRVGNGDFGAAFELPFLDGEDFMNWRATVDYSLIFGDGRL